MTEAQKRLRNLLDRQSRERASMAELGKGDKWTDETRAEYDGLEAGVPDLEREIRAARSAVDTQEAESCAKGGEGTSIAPTRNGGRKMEGNAVIHSETRPLHAHPYHRPSGRVTRPHPPESPAGRPKGQT